MANYIESSEVARPYRASKRRGPQPDKLSVKLFLLDPKNDVTRINKDTWSQKERTRLRSIGYGPPQSDLINKDNKIQFPFSMTTEEFKNRLVEIYPKLQDKRFLLLRADKSNVLQGLNIAPCYYNPEDIYHSNLGQGTLYIKCLGEDIQITLPGLSPSKRARTTTAEENSSGLLVYRTIQPKPTSETATSGSSFSMVTSSAAFTWSNSAVRCLPAVSSSTSTAIVCSNSSSAMAGIVATQQVAPAQIIANQNRGIGLTTTSTGLENYCRNEVLSTGVEGLPQQEQERQQRQRQQQIPGTQRLDVIPQQQLQQPGQVPERLNQQQQLQQFFQQPVQSERQQQLPQMLQERQEQQQQLVQVPQDLELQQLLLQQLQQPRQSERQQEFQQPPPEQQSRVQEPQVSQISCQHQQLQQGFQSDVLFQRFLQLSQQQQQQQEQQRQGQQPQQQMQQQHVPIQQLSPENVQQHVTQLMPNSVNSLPVSRNMVASQSQTAAVSSSLPVFRPPNTSVTQSLSYQRFQDASLTNNGVTKISSAFPLTFRNSVNVPPVQQTSHNNQASTFASSESLLSTTSPVYIPSSLQNDTDSASPLNTLADATVERGPINSDESFDIQNSDLSGTTVDSQEDLPISRCDEFNLDDFIEDVQRTGHLKVSEKVFKSDDLVTRLESVNLNIQSMEIHEYCKVDKSLKRLPLPSSLKVLLVKKNRLDDSDVSSVCNVFFKLSGLEELDLSSTKFVSNSFMVLSGLANLKSVKCLSLCDCGISKQETLILVAVLESLKDLEVLNLSSNKLSDENANMLISVLSKSKRFKVLDLSNNVLTANKAVVTGLSMLKTVEKLDFSSNYLSVESVDNETKEEQHFPCNVTEISLSSNRMVPDDFGNFCQYLSSSVLLEKLEIDSNYIGHSIWSLHSVAWKFPNLKVLKLSNTQLWVATDGLKCLLSNVGQLEELYLASNNFLLKDFQKLGPVLSTLMHLRVLDISDNSVDFSISAVLQRVLSRVLNLEVLKMRSNHFDADRLKAICPSIASLTCLKSLDLSNNWLGSEGAAQLAEVLPSLRKLENLDLRKTRMCGDGMNKLCSAVGSMKNIKSLCLGHNKLCSEAISALANSLPSLSLIEDLNLSATGLNGLGVEDIFHSCGVFENLKRISLRKNELDLRGSSALGKALLSMPLLEELDLKKCYLDDECLKCICHSVSSLNGLRKLNLSYSRLSQAGCDALAIELPLLQSLQELQLGSINSMALSSKLIDAIISLKCLRILDLNFNTDSNLEANLACVLPSLQLLEELMLTGGGCDNLLKQFISLGRLNFLKRFELKTVRFTCCCATALGKMLFLEKLVLDYEFYDEAWYCEWDRDRDCNLEKLMRSIESLKHLKTLRIPSLWLMYAAFASVLKSLSSLESLTFILCDDDDLTYYCECCEVFMSIGSLKYLRELSLPGINLCSDRTAGLTTVLPSLLLLEKLTIAGCYDDCRNDDHDHDDHDDDCAKLFGSFKSLTHLRTLHINCYDLSFSSVSALADILPSLQLLEELELVLTSSHNSEKLILSIKSFAFLKKLTVRLVACSTDVAALASILPSLQLLKSLTIEVRNFSDYGKIFPSLKRLVYLKKLKLILQRISSIDVETFASVLPSLQFLEKLKITYECDCGVFEKVLHSLKSLNCLKILHVSGIKTTSTGAAALPGLLQSIQPLEELKMSLTVHDNDNNFKLFLSSISKNLELSGDKVGSSGVSAVNGVLGSQPLLEKLVVNVTCCDDEEKLFPSFKSLKCLKELTLWKNGLSSDGISALVSVLPVLRLLERLDLGGTKITSAAVEPLVQVLPSLPSLNKVYFRGNDLTQADQHKIRSAASPGVFIFFS